MRKGAFVVVEGIDGSGSTSVVAELAAHFRAQQRQVHATCEPSSGPFGVTIRQILSHSYVVPGRASPSFGWATMALLFAADRLDHLEAEVLPHLHAGDLVLSDRYDLSSLAYQSATAQPDGPAPAADPVKWIRELNRCAQRPDLTLVLDVDPDVAAERRKSRGGKAELYEKLELQRRLAALYADAEQLVVGDRVVHVDANQPLPLVIARSVEAVEAIERR
jgi:dTMP kinase